MEQYEGGSESDQSDYSDSEVAAVKRADNVIVNQELDLSADGKVELTELKTEVTITNLSDADSKKLDVLENQGIVNLDDDFLRQQNEGKQEWKWELDVHDGEGLDENYVGYGTELERSSQFGLASLRLGRSLQPGFVLTVEPGLYFIPALIDRWHADGMHPSFIDYDVLDTWRDFGGVRIEDDVAVTADGHKVLGEPIPKLLDEVETLLSE